MFPTRHSRSSLCLFQDEDASEMNWNPDALRDSSSPSYTIEMTQLERICLIRGTERWDFRRRGDVLLVDTNGMYSPICITREFGSKSAKSTHTIHPDRKGIAIHKDGFRAICPVTASWKVLRWSIPKYGIFMQGQEHMFSKSSRTSAPQFGPPSQTGEGGFRKGHS